MAYKIVKCIFISFLAVFLMSYNSFAVGLSESVNFNNEYVNPYWHDNNNTTWSNGSISYSTNNSAHPSANAIYFRSNNNTNISASVGQYYSFVGTVIATGMSSGQSNKSGFFGISTTSTDCPILDLDSVEVEATPQGGNNEQRTVRYTVSGICRVMSAITTGPTINFYVSPTTTSTALATTIQWHNLTKWDADTPVSTINTRLNEIKTQLGNIQTYLDDILSDLNYIKDNLDAQGEAAQKELDSTDNIENQTEPTQDTGDNAASTNLIGNISSVITQIGNIPASSSCNIPANWGNLNLGNLNLCTGKENMPWVVNFGAQVFQFVFVIGTGIILVKQVLALYDWSRK